VPKNKLALTSAHFSNSRLYWGGIHRAKNAGFEVGAQKLPDDIALLKDLADEGVIIPTPAGDYDDSYCIQYAYRCVCAHVCNKKNSDDVSFCHMIFICSNSGYIVTNDRYRDYKARGDVDSSEMHRWIQTHTISYTFVEDEFLPNPDFSFQTDLT
jgi:hypothetical protein